MKKLLWTVVVCVLLAVATPVCAGSVDGLWVVSAENGVFMLVRENAGFVLVVPINVIDVGPWSAYFGAFTGFGDRLSLSTLVNVFEEVEFELTFSSENTATAVLRKCISRETRLPCDGPPEGVPIPISKVF